MKKSYLFAGLVLTILACGHKSKSRGGSASPEPNKTLLDIADQKSLQAAVQRDEDEASLSQLEQDLLSKNITFSAAPTGPSWLLPPYLYEYRSDLNDENLAQIQELQSQMTKIISLTEQLLANDKMSNDDKVNLENKKAAAEHSLAFIDARVRLHDLRKAHQDLNDLGLGYAVVSQPDQNGKIVERSMTYINAPESADGFAALQQKLDTYATGAYELAALPAFQEKASWQTESFSEALTREATLARTISLQMRGETFFLSYGIKLFNSNDQDRLTDFSTTPERLKILGKHASPEDVDEAANIAAELLSYADALDNAIKAMDAKASKNLVVKAAAARDASALLTQRVNGFRYMQKITALSALGLNIVSDPAKESTAVWSKQPTGDQLRDAKQNFAELSDYFTALDEHARSDTMQKLTKAYEQSLLPGNQKLTDPLVFTVLSSQGLDWMITLADELAIFDAALNN